MRDELLGRLKAYFLEAGYGPDDRIDTEHALAGRFGVSRARVREALTALCQEGLLERRARAGTRVKAFDAGATAEALSFRFRMAGFDTSDATEARWVVESAVLPLAVRRMTPALFEKLCGHIAAMEALKTDLEAADRHDRDFHLTLLEASGNRTLQAFAGVIESLFRSTVRRQFWTAAMVDRSIREHRALCAAIDAGETAKALTILTKHLHPSRYRDPAAIAASRRKTYRRGADRG